VGIPDLMKSTRIAKNDGTFNNDDLSENEGFSA
jgi:hypothetical protein